MAKLEFDLCAFSTRPPSRPPSRAPRPGSTRPTTPPTAAAACARLRELIAESDQSQVEIADQAGMHPTQLWPLASGGNVNPKLATVARVLAAMGKTWADLD